MKKIVLNHLTWFKALAAACMLFAMHGCFDDGALREQMRDFEERLADLEGTVIADLNDQISGIKASVEALGKVDAELQTYVDELDDVITALEKRVQEVETSLNESEPEPGPDPNTEAIKALEAEIASLKTALEDLVAMDLALDAKVEDLRGFVSDELKADKEWTESTFATLEQYEVVETEIASVKESLKDLEAGLADLADALAVLEEKHAGEVGELADVLAALSETHKGDVDGLKDVTRQLFEDISATEEGMKTWVNEKLAESYYDIAAVDAKLAELKKEYADADDALQSQVSAQQDSLGQAKKDLTTAYEKAIADAIEKNNGVLDSKIADVVKTAQEILQEEINAFNDFVTSMEARLSALESDFVNRIQSLVYIPEYSDGKIVVYQNDPSFALEFLITPVKLAAELQNLWATDHSIFQAGLCYVKDPETRAASNIVPLDVVSVEGTATGVLRLVVAENEDVPLKEDFWKGVASALAYIHITDGKNDFASDMILLHGRLGGDIDFEGATDLSKYQPGSSSEASSATANCYLVSKSGQFKFPALKGNSNESVGDVASAAVLWESFGTSEAPSTGDLIRSVGCRNGLIGFETAVDFREGNAVIAAKDAAGNILWSWHIWFTDKPAEQEYYNGAGTMMDRNLGATSATPGDVGALGLLYQWGRKDPFLGSSSVSEAVVAASTYEWPAAVASDANIGTVGYAVSNPTTFITGNAGNSDWQYAGDDTRWNSSKTVYDPCPAGWRVPDGGEQGVWATAKGSSGQYEHGFDSNKYGMSFSETFASEAVWYPAAGYIDNSSAFLNHAAVFGRYWSCTFSPDNEPYRLGFGQNGYLFFTASYLPSDAHSVRCLKEGSRTDIPINPDPEPEVDFDITLELVDKTVLTNGLMQDKSVKLNAYYMRTEDQKEYVPVSSSWKSSDESIATVDAAGNVTAVIEHIENKGIENGKRVTITHIADHKQKSVEIVVVKALPEQVIMTAVPSVDGVDYRMMHHDSFVFKAKVLPEKANQDVWYAGGEHLQLLPGKPFVANTVGDVEITAYAADNTSVPLRFTITVLPVRLESMAVVGDAARELTVGDEDYLSVSFTPENASYKTVTWTAVPEGIVSVDSNGKITALQAGVAQVIGTVQEEGKSVTYDITVSKPAVKINVGDYYYSDGTVSSEYDAAKTVVGIVFSTQNPTLKDPDLKGTPYVNGFAVALNDAAQKIPWQTSNARVSTDLGVQDRYCGYSNTKILVEYNKTAAESNIVNVAKDLPSEKPAANTTSWYVPSYAELLLIKQNLDKLQTNIETAGGTRLYDTWNVQKEITTKRAYWSSTENSTTASQAYAVHMSQHADTSTPNGQYVENQNKVENKNNQVRYIFAF